MKTTLQVLLILCLLILLLLMAFHGSPFGKKTTQVCPVNAISMLNGKAVIEASQCIGCRRCVDGVLIPTAKPEPGQAVVTPEASVPETLAAQTKAPLDKATITNAKPSTATASPKAKTEANATSVKQAHTVDPAKCIGCKLCVSRCPVDAITMVNNLAVIDKEKCINCGICANGNNDDFNGCPVGAIKGP